MAHHHHIMPTSDGMILTNFVCLLALCIILHSRGEAFVPSTFTSARQYCSSSICILPSPAAAKPTSSTLHTTPSTTYDMIVIGGGSAGLTAAKFASTFGKSVCLIESSRVGGDCTWTGCIPSKTMLAAAKRVHTWRRMNERYGNGKDDNNNSYDASLHEMLRDIKRDIDENRQRIYDEDDSPEVLASLGIQVVHGRAFFHDAKTVNVTKNEWNDEDSDGSTHQLHAKYGIVIASGATPSTTLLENIAGLDTIPYWTYENVWDEFFLAVEKRNRKRDTEKLMKVIVVGGGPIGCELSQAMSRLGCSVVLVSKSPRLLPDADVEASMELQRVLENEGIDVMCNQAVVSVTTESSSKESGDGSTIKVSLSSQESILGDHILVSTGRVPNINNMGLENIGLQINDDTNGGGICVDSKLQTTVKGIFSAGDCTGDRQFTHYAGFQGAIAARNILLPLKDVGVLSDVPSTTFTDPEVSSVGLTEPAAIDQYGESDVSISFRKLSKIDRAICEGVDSNGFIKIVYNRRTKQILGASIVSPSAGELISEIAVARDAHLPFDQLATVMHSYPSYSIALQQMAAEVYYDKLKKNRVYYDVLKKLGL
ncbi:hypothetical protein ACHAWU_007883 [Discostella pseudostelligera]|uniref:Mercuric reductase n=1 Tax=Discostella pseudostelligera TaxID=259834 RepID=A0ABD3MB35_9STRA